jgi:hypothetical protein
MEQSQKLRESAKITEFQSIPSLKTPKFIGKTLRYFAFEESYDTIGKHVLKAEVRNV